MLDRVDDNGSDTRLMIIESEFSRLVETMARTGQFSERLREAWDGTPMANTTKKNPTRATHAHISLVGSITPEKLEHHHKRLSQGGGLESRLLYCISAPDINDDANPFAGGLVDFPDLVDRLRLTLDVSRSAVLDRTDPISRGIFMERGTGWQPSVVLPVHDTVQGGWRALVRDRLPRADNDAVANLWARGEVQVVRLAAAYAIGTASDSVTAEHVDAAVACWKYCAESAEALFGIAAGPEDGAGDRAARRKVLEYLLRCAGKAGGWVTQTQLNKGAFQGNARRGEVAHVLKYLVDKGYAEYRATPTRGRPKHEYRLPRRVANGLTEEAPNRRRNPSGYRQGRTTNRTAHPRRAGRSPGPRGGPGGRARESASTMTTPEGAPSALALRVWDLDRQHLALRSFNARPAQTPPWWIDTAFSEPTGGWPKDRPLVAECKAKGEHTPHLPECREDCEEHDGGIPAPNCRCGIYCTRSLSVVSDYLRAANEPVLGIVEMGGRFIWPSRTPMGMRAVSTPASSPFCSSTGRSPSTTRHCGIWQRPTGCPHWAGSRSTPRTRTSSGTRSPLPPQLPTRPKNGCGGFRGVGYPLVPQAPGPAQRAS